MIQKNFLIKQPPYDYRNQTLFLNSLLEHCSQTTYYNYQAFFANAPISAELRNLCLKKLEEDLNERAALLMYMQFPERHIINTATSILAHMMNRSQFSSNTHYLNQLRKIKVTNVTNICVVHMMHGYKVTPFIKAKLEAAISPFQFTLYYLRYLIFLETYEIASLINYNEHYLETELNHMIDSISKIFSTINWRMMK